MGDFFEDLGKAITDMANDIGKKTEDTIEVQKIKSDVRMLRRANDRDIMDIGRMVYDKFQKGEVTDMDAAKLCETIEKRSEEIGRREEEIRRIKEGRV